MYLQKKLALSYFILIVPILATFILLANPSFTEDLSVFIHPITRYIHITYTVPADAPDEVIIQCLWSPIEENNWQPAKVLPYISETALNFVSSEEWRDWAYQGHIHELASSGLQRTVIFNPYPSAQINGKVHINFRIQIQTTDGKLLSTQQSAIQVDNSDVIYLEDWTQIFQKDQIVPDRENTTDRKWLFQTDLDPNTVTYNNALIGPKWRDDLPLPQLSYPLNLNGWYAIYVCTPDSYGIRLRLSGDERTDVLASPRPFQEVLWKWCPLDRQNLIIQQHHSYQGYAESRLDYIKLVPLTAQQVQELENQFGIPDKIIIGYFEPYSWAFYEDIQTPLQHREPILAYKEARINIVDAQIGRLGAKVVYESRLTDSLLYNTIGDPIGGIVPHTSNVGKMQQYTNTLQAELQYAHELGLTLHANFGATNCYPGTPLQSDFVQQHPEWVSGPFLRYNIPEVQEYILSLINEALQIGADGISIDFCRYPGGIDTLETCNQFLRRLKNLRNEFAQKRNKPVLLLLRFPAHGVSQSEKFDYPTWVKEELVDYLCPSNIQGRHHHFDITPYFNAVRGTNCKLLPVVDGLSWGPDIPGPFLWRVQQIFDAGADGVYVYQADARTCLNNRPSDRRYMRLISSRQAVHKWWQNFAEQNKHYSRRIWLQPSEDGDLEYHNWERCRIWIEGIQPEEVQILLDGQIINTYSRNGSTMDINDNSQTNDTKGRNNNAKDANKINITSDEPTISPVSSSSLPSSTPHESFSIYNSRLPFTPVYILGGEDYTYDNLITPGPHTLTIHAKARDITLTQTFTISGPK